MDKRVRVFDLEHLNAPPLVADETIDKLRCVAYCQDDTLLLVSYIDKPNLEYVVQVVDAVIHVDHRVWDARTLTKVRTLETSGAVRSTEVSKDGRYVLYVHLPCGVPADPCCSSYIMMACRYITTADGKFAKVWDGASFAEIKSLESVNGEVESASYCPEANLLATGGEDMWVHVYDATTYEQRDVCKGVYVCVCAYASTPQTQGTMARCTVCAFLPPQRRWRVGQRMGRYEFGRWRRAAATAVRGDMSLSGPTTRTACNFTRSCFRCSHTLLPGATNVFRTPTPLQRRWAPTALPSCCHTPTC